MSLFSTILIFFTLVVFNQYSYAQIYNSDKLSYATVYLENDTTSGTGSFFATKTDMYILTASHVAKNMDKDAILFICDTNSKPIKFKLSEITDTLKWIKHPIADLAILKLKLSENQIKKYFQGRFLSIDIISKDKKAIPRNIQLTVIGFPLGFGVKEYFSPLTFRTFASSGLLTFNRFDTNSPQVFIVLENPSIGGYSGGPVFELAIYNQGYLKATGTKTIMHGIIHGTLFDNTGGKLAAVTPSFYLFDLIK